MFWLTKKKQKTETQVQVQLPEEIFPQATPINQEFFGPFRRDYYSIAGLEGIYTFAYNRTSVRAWIKGELRYFDREQSHEKSILHMADVIESTKVKPVEFNSSQSPTIKRIK